MSPLDPDAMTCVAHLRNRISAVLGPGHSPLFCAFYFCIGLSNIFFRISFPSEWGLIFIGIGKPDPSISSIDRWGCVFEICSEGTLKAGLKRLITLLDLTQCHVLSILTSSSQWTIRWHCSWLYDHAVAVSGKPGDTRQREWATGALPYSKKEPPKYMEVFGLLPKQVYLSFGDDWT